MKYLSLFLSIFLFVSIFAFSISGGYGGVQIVGTYQNNDNLSASLSNVNISLDNTLFGMGGGGMFITNGFVIGGSGFGGTRNYATQDLKIEYSYGSGKFEFGPIFDLKLFNLGIILGLGGGGESMKLRPNLSDISFDSLLINPGRVSTLSRGGMEIGASLLILYKMNNFIALSLKGGATYGFGWQWQLDDGATVYNQPEDMPLRITSSLGILFGGSTKSD